MDCNINDGTCILWNGLITIRQDKRCIEIRRTGLSDYALKLYFNQELLSNKTSENSANFDTMHFDCHESYLQISKSMSADNDLIKVTIAMSSDQLDSIEGSVVFQDSHWYGGTETFNQTWPIESTEIGVCPYYTHDIFEGAWGGIMERYWLSSQKIAITVPDEVPLWIGLNKNFLTLKAQYTGCKYVSFIHQRTPKTSLVFTIWISEDAGLNLKDFHMIMVKSHLGKPVGLPDKRMMEQPIWCTWVQFGQNVDETVTTEYAAKINSLGFNNSQLEIDDRWATKYGDFEMDSNKFPHSHRMIDKLHKMGFRVTMWIHPFANHDSIAANNPDNAKFWVKNTDGFAGSVKWWDGTGFMLDTTNTKAVDWFVENLTKFRKDIGFDSYKFDAGEVNWFPEMFRLANATHINEYTKTYAEMASRLDNNIEVRVGYRTQKLPVFVRLMDKSSTWGIDNGLAAMLASVLNVGILGYPFILPDMVGGSVMKQGMPDKELYIRWMQASALLPSIQISIAPWEFDDEVIQNTKDMLALRQTWMPTMWGLAEIAVTSGKPIVRPLWWIDESDEALTCSSQFLVGSELMVAPVLVCGARSRMVYIPKGLWQCALDGVTHSGPRTIEQPARLFQLPHYIAMHD